MLHDQSASGSTLFIEPMDIVSLNNELKKLSMDEELEIYNILKRISIEIADCIATLDNNARVCILVDTIFAKREYAKNTHSTRPILNNNGTIDLRQVRHPLIAVDKVVPIDIKIDKKRVLLISGPNTGGKTVTIKSLGLLSLLAASGVCLPCSDGSQICIFDNIYCCVGDQQSITNAFSTFSSHILRIKDILQQATQNSLVLIDELCAGTDPEEGVAIAIAITQHILQIGCTAAITSHYGRLKDFGVANQQIESASMHFDSTKLEPTYKLLLGVAGASNAIAICKRLGLSSDIIKNAEQNLSTNSIQYNALLAKTQETYFLAEQQLTKTQELNTQLSQQLQSVEIQKQQLLEKQNKVLQNAGKETERLVSIAKQEANDIIDKIKDKLMIADEAALLQAKQLSSQLDKLQKPKEQSINYQNLNTMPKKGDTVIVKSIGSQGIVKDIQKDTIFVVVGAATIKCILDNLAKPNIVETNQSKPQNIVKIKDIKGASADSEIAEITVIGQTVAEALTNIEPFLQNCHLSGRKKVRIVHGKGTGVLGKSIQKYLRNIKYIQEYRYGGYGEGERGVTIVMLR